MHKAAAVALGALLAAAAAPVGAQSDTASRNTPTSDSRSPSGRRAFSVTPTVGSMQWDYSSGLSTRQHGDNGGFNDSYKITPTVGVMANYQILEALGLGFYFDASRPETRGDFFPAAIFRYGDRAELAYVNQRVTALLYGVQAQLTAPRAFFRLEPYVAGGVGAITINADPQQNDGNVTFTNSSAQWGGGLAYRVGGGKIVLDARDFMAFSWKRDKLYMVAPEYQNTQIPAANAAVPEAKKTINNFRLALGFSFVPRFMGGGEAGEGGGDQE